MDNLERYWPESPEYMDGYRDGRLVGITLADEFLHAHIAELEANIEQVRQAIESEGPVPAYHRAVMHNRRAKWPTLWAALDALLTPKDVP